METLWLFPVLGGATGWLTVWVGARLVFRPRRPRRVLGVELRGFVPAHRVEVAEAIAAWVEREVSLHGAVEKALDDPNLREALRKGLEERVREHVLERGAANGGLLGRLVNEQLAGGVATAASYAALKVLPPLLREAARGLEKHLDIGRTVRTKLGALDDEALERAFADHVGRQVARLGALSATMGFVLGLGFALAAWLLG